jgi:ABC-type bacteriocin/lantibiotic exporter with double-glycine peptidase domain
MFALFNQYENPVTVTLQLLKQLKVKVTDYTVNETILNHPDYPSLLSISDALDSFHIKNAAIRIDPQKVHELPLPFIAFTRAKGGSFILITEVKNENVFYIDEANKIKSKPLQDFFKEFKDVVLLAQANKIQERRIMQRLKKSNDEKICGYL